jgi:phosphoribosylformylglycinamidine (FGAM) synthase-like amidotransferase family enzyme
MKRNPHIIVQQVCPCRRTKDGEYEVQVAIVRYKGITCRHRMGYATKRHARWAQHLICTTKNASRLRCCSELKALIEKGGLHEDDA